MVKILNKCRTMKKTAAVTGATSGIGRDIARILGRMGYHLIITGRNEKELIRLTYELGKNNVTAIRADLSDEKDCLCIYRLSKEYNTEILVNNAGMGVYGEFTETSLAREMEMLDVNVRAVHILTKLFLKRFVREDQGYILNVASAAGYMPGPLMAGYYATKSYVVNLTEAVRAELKAKRSNVRVCLFCPGPVKTDFNARAGVKGAFSGISSEEAAKQAAAGMFAGKSAVIPTAGMRLLCAVSGALPKGLVSDVNYYVQKLKKRAGTPPRASRGVS